MDRLKYFLTEINTDGHKAYVNISFLEHISGSTLESDCLQIVHTSPLGALAVPLGVYEP